MDWGHMVWGHPIHFRWGLINVHHTEIKLFSNITLYKNGIPYCNDSVIWWLIMNHDGAEFIAVCVCITFPSS